jgi:lipoate---protein ligase
MGEMWRAIDTGLRPAAQNIALSRALLEARQAEEIPSTLRFLRFAPSALLACRQSPAQEFDPGYCASAGITVQRRITGGDAIYCDENQLGWELYLHRRDIGNSGMLAVAKRICHAAATAIGALGVDARFRPRHDIEIDGRVISRGGGAFDDDALLYQGILLIDSDSGNMRRAMRMPTTPWMTAAPHPARERIADLKSMLGECPDIARIKRDMTAAFESEFEVEFQEGDLSLTEHARYQRALAEIDAPDWINLIQQPATDAPICVAVQKVAGGLLHASVIYDRTARRIKQVRFNDDIDISPWRTLADLEAALRDIPVDRLGFHVRTFFAGRATAMSALTPDDFVAVVRRALTLPIIAQNP